MLRVIEAHFGLNLPSHGCPRFVLIPEHSASTACTKVFALLTPLGTQRGPHAACAPSSGATVYAGGDSDNSVTPFPVGETASVVRIFVANSGAKIETDPAFLGALRGLQLTPLLKSPLPHYPHHLYQNLEQRRHAGHEFETQSMVARLLDTTTLIYHSDVHRTFDFSTEIP